MCAARGLPGDPVHITPPGEGAGDQPSPECGAAVFPPNRGGDPAGEEHACGEPTLFMRILAVAPIPAASPLVSDEQPGE